MTLRANRQNLKKYAKELLGNEYTVEREKTLIKACLNPPQGYYGHPSHKRAEHLEIINSILHNFGVEGMLLDKHGNDLSSTCSEQGVACDIQYSNAGDTYDMTIMYYNGKLCIGDWGSIVERLS